MIGETLGSYRIRSEIGSGGMGVVYLAEHTLLGRKAAVKLLRSDMPSEYVERFFNEAKAAATLHHPGLVDVFDFGHHKDGSAFIVMEFLSGESLEQRLAREPRLPTALALSITRSVANALHVAHEQGIIHRDLKPGNIFLVVDSEAPSGIRTKVLDFGIAKLMRDRDARSVKTQSGAVIGTPRYMSPEQCKNAKTVDGRADIYSLGCMLYEMLLGVAPFDYDSWAELVGAHIYEIPPRPSEIDASTPADIETLIGKMLEKAPDDRFASMHDLAQSVEVLLLTHGDRVRLTPPSLQRLSAKRLGTGRSDKQAAAVAVTGAFADTDMKKAGAETLGGDTVLDPKTLQQALDAEPEPEPAKPTPPAPTPEPQQEPEPVVQTSPVPRAGKTPWAAILIGGAGLVALAVAGALFLAKTSKPQSETAFIVVDKRAEGSAVRDPVVAPVAIDAGAVQLEPPPDAGTTPSTNTRRPPRDTDVSALTRTFGKQGPAITACFKQHGETTEKVSVRIQIDRHGIVRAVGVLPEAVGSTPLGACIAGVATKTQFGPQPKPATFRVPLYTSAR